ncbi:ANTAR domain-containing response regulator [Rubripirellula reticaptiva]|nr:ANTAR domain-containing protein [Rubripirellula reticaptiva]
MNDSESNGGRVSKRIYLAHGDCKTRSLLKVMLQTLGHRVGLDTDSGSVLMEFGLSDPPDMFISSKQLRDMDGIEALIRIGEEKPRAAVVVAGSADLDDIERAMKDHVMAYLIEPVTEEDLQPAIYLAQRQFHYLESLRTKVESLETRLHSRAIIERAKGIVMLRKKLNEMDAHKFLQDTARDQRKKIVEIAETIVNAESFLN